MTIKEDDDVRQFIRKQKRRTKS